MLSLATNFRMKIPNKTGGHDHHAMTPKTLLFRCSKIAVLSYLLSLSFCWMLLWPENFLLCSSSHLSKVPLNSDAFSFAVVDDLHSIISNPICLPGGKLTWKNFLFSIWMYILWMCIVQRPTKLCKYILTCWFYINFRFPFNVRSYLDTIYSKADLFQILSKSINVQILGTGLQYS